MRILIASTVPPRRAGAGAELQVQRMAEGLALSHEVRLVALGAGDSIPGVASVYVADPPEGVARVARKLRALVGGEPYLVQHLRTTGLATAVERARDEFRPDVVYLTNGPASYLLPSLAGTPTVLNTIDSWTENERQVRGVSGSAMRRILDRLLLRGIGRFETAHLGMADRIITVSEGDSAVVRALSGLSDRVVTVSNGVDTDFFRPLDADAHIPVVGFHGTMDYAPNVEAARFLVDQVMPAVWAKRPEVQVSIAGRNPDPAVLQLADERVAVLGAVEDIRRPIADATVCVFPMLSGSGVKNKVLEAAAMARPIVLTSSALGDLQLVEDGGAVLANTPEDLARGVLGLLDDPEEAQAIGERARNSVRQRHSWMQIARSCGDVCEAAMADHSPQSSASPQFTVFTPTYNRRDTLHRVHRSLEAQTFRDFEWLIVDDGSTDGTDELVAQWAATSSFPIRYLSQQNSGKHVALNRAVREAEGELFVTLDSDDGCTPDALEVLRSRWLAIPASQRDGFVGVSVNGRTPDGTEHGTPFPRSPLDSNAAEIRMRYRMQGDKWGFCRTDVLRKYPFPEGGRFVSEDLVWFEIAKHYRTRFVNDWLWIYHIDDGAEHLSSLGVPVLNGRADLCRKILDDFPPRHPVELLAYAKAAVNFSRYSMDLGRAPVEFIRAPQRVRGTAMVALASPLGAVLAHRDRARLR